MKLHMLSPIGAAALVFASALTAMAQTAETQVLPSETYTNISTQMLPTPPVLTGKYTLPMKVVVAKDVSITSDAPLTDQYKYGKTEDLTAWSEAVRQCLKSRPVMVRVVGDQSLPFILNKEEGKLKLNANDKPVCIQ